MAHINVCLYIYIYFFFFIYYSFIYLFLYDRVRAHVLENIALLPVYSDAGIFWLYIYSISKP